MILNKFEIVRDYIPVTHNTRPGIISPRTGFLVAHDTGNPGSTARGNRNYFEGLGKEYLAASDKSNVRSASAHTFIDDKSILVLIPDGTDGKPTEKAWHVRYDVKGDNQLFGDDANDIAIGTELCFGGTINFKEAYARYVWYHALICYQHKLDPKRSIVSHKQLDPGRKIDPQNALTQNGVSFTEFIADVQAELNEVIPDPNPYTLGAGVAQTIIRTWLVPEWFKLNTAGDKDGANNVHALADALRFDAAGTRKLQKSEADIINSTWVAPAWNGCAEQSQKDYVHWLANELRKAAGMPTT
jgi:N-acetylmuramoyl-L-alanine amidase